MQQKAILTGQNIHGKINIANLSQLSLFRVRGKTEFEYRKRHERCSLSPIHHTNWPPPFQQSDFVFCNSDKMVVMTFIERDQLQWPMCSETIMITELIRRLSLNNQAWYLVHCKNYFLAFTCILHNPVQLFLEFRMSKCYNRLYTFICILYIIIREGQIFQCQL